MEINCAIASNNALLQPSLEENAYLHLELFLVNVSHRLFYSELLGRNSSRKSAQVEKLYSKVVASCGKSEREVIP